MITVMIRSYESNPSHHHLNQSFFQNCHFRLISSFFFISKLLKIVKINKKTQAVWMLVKSCLSPGFHGLLKLSHCCGLQPRGWVATMMYEDFCCLQNRWWYGCLPICTQMCHNTGKTFEVIHDDFMCDFTWILTNLKLKKTTHLNKINSSHYGCLNRLMARWDSEDPIWNWSNVVVAFKRKFYQFVLAYSHSNIDKTSSFHSDVASECCPLCSKEAQMLFLALKGGVRKAWQKKNDLQGAWAQT